MVKYVWVVLVFPIVMMGHDCFLRAEDITGPITDVSIDPWPPASASKPSIQDLFREYNQIFKRGNRNAASHRWATFLLDRSYQMTIRRLEFFFSGFCSVSGSPVRPSDYNRYRLSLPLVGTGTNVTGFMHYCCWPCVCDTQDFIRVDTKSVITEDGLKVQRYFTVIGNPCEKPELLNEPFIQPFYGGQATTIAETAREVNCVENVLEGATMSDNGYVIIGMFFDATPTTLDLTFPLENEEPGRISTVEHNEHTIIFQDEREWESSCKIRAENGYNSGMGEIFRKVSAISPIPSDEINNDLSIAIDSSAHSDSNTHQEEESKPNISEQSCESKPKI